MTERRRGAHGRQYRRAAARSAPRDRRGDIRHGAYPRPNNPNACDCCRGHRRGRPGDSPRRRSGRAVERLAGDAGSPAPPRSRGQPGRERAPARSRRRERRNAGPFVPVVGKVDYGTAENAFGAARSGHVHAGQDMFAPAGTPLVAATDARRRSTTGTDGGQGNYVYLYDPKRDRTYVYMHMIEPARSQAGRAGRGRRAARRRRLHRLVLGRPPALRDPRRQGLRRRRRAIRCRCSRTGTRSTKPL